MFRPKGEFIGEGCRIDVRPKSRMLGDIFHTLPVIIDRMMEVFKTLDVIFFGNNSFHFFTFSSPPSPLWGEGKGEGKFQMPLGKFL
jgi:hypothetical protein